MYNITYYSFIEKSSGQLSDILLILLLLIFTFYQFISFIMLFAQPSHKPLITNIKTNWINNNISLQILLNIFFAIILILSHIWFITDNSLMGNRIIDSNLIFCLVNTLINLYIYKFYDWKIFNYIKI